MTAPNINVSVGANVSALDPAFRQGVESARQFGDKLKQELTQRLAQISASLAQGLLPPDQAAKAGAEAGRAFTRALQLEIKAAPKEIGQGAELEGYVAGLTGQLAKVEQAGGGAALSLTALRRPLTALADSALGVSGPIGQIASRLGLMALGGNLVVGVIAGIAAIGAAYEFLTEDARKATQQIEDSLKRADEIINSTHPTIKLSADVSAFDKSIAELERRIADLQKNVAYGTSSASVGATGMIGGYGASEGARADNAAEQAKLQAERDKLQHGRDDAARQQHANDLRAVEDNARLVASLESVDTRYQQIARSLAAQYDAKAKDVTLAAADRAAYAAMVTTLEAFDKAQEKHGEKQATYLADLARQAAGEQAAADALMTHGDALKSVELEAERQKAITEALTKTTGAHRDQVVALVNTYYDAKELVAALTEELKAQAAAYEHVSAAAAKLAPAATAASKNFTKIETPPKDNQDEWTAWFHDAVAAAMKNVVKPTDPAAKAFAKAMGETVEHAVADGVLAGLQDGVLGGHSFWETFSRMGEDILGQAIEKVLSKYAKSGAFQALGGAAAAGVAGYDVGYATGGKSQAVGALAGAGAGAATGALIGSVVPVVGTALGAVVGGAIGAIGGLIGAHKHAKDAAEAMAKAQEAAAEAENNARATVLGLIGSTNNDLNLRELRAQGRDADGDALERTVAEQEEYYKLLNAGVPQEVLDRLRQVQQEEDAHAASLAAEADAERRAQAEATAGQQESAENARAKAAYDDAAALKAATDAENARVALLNKTTTEDLHYRELVAEGRTDEADAYKRQLDEQREAQQLIDEGADASTLATLHHVQALEDERAATEKATQAAKDAAQAQRDLSASALDAYAKAHDFLGVGDSPVSFGEEAVLATKTNPLIAQWLDGVDLSDPHAVNAAITRGIAGIDAGVLDQYSPDQITQFNQAVGIGSQLRTSGAFGNSAALPADALRGTAFTADVAQVTEATAGALVDAERAQTALLQASVHELEDIHALIAQLSPRAFVPIEPPALPGAFGVGGGDITVNVGDISASLELGELVTGAADASALLAELGTLTGAEIARAMGPALLDGIRRALKSQLGARGDARVFDALGGLA